MPAVVEKQVDYENIAPRTVVDDAPSNDFKYREERRKNG